MKIVLSVGLLVVASLVANVAHGANSALSNANDDFGLRLMQNLEPIEWTKSMNTRNNLFISPFSIGSVLAMLLAGGVQETYSQIYETLGLNSTNLTNSELFHHYQKLIDDLNKNSKSSSNIVSVANAIAIQKNYALNQDFLNNITTYFESQVFVEDFAKAGNQSTQDINSWVADKTQGKITKLIDQNLDANTAIVLLNAIYFKGNWKVKFDQKKTQPNFYFRPDDPNEQKPIAWYMTQTGVFNYAQFKDGQMIEIPYQNQTLSMYVFLPPYGFNHSISSLFNARKFEQQIALLIPQQVTLYLPKFQIQQSYSLADSLQQLGIENAFNGKADFSNIDGTKSLRISKVVHKTFIDVNEQGSEAAASTGVVIAPPNAMEHVPVQPIDFRADHPFIFWIRDKQHQLTLFMGVVNNPGKQ